MGRKPAPPVLLPIIWDDEVQRVADWLQERAGPQRWPEQTARVLVLVVKLYLDGRRPWPVRRQVAEHLGVSLPMLDVVINQRQASKDITVRYAPARGNIAKHDSVITEKFIAPSQELIDLVIGGAQK